MSVGGGGGYPHFTNTPPPYVDKLVIHMTGCHMYSVGDQDKLFTYHISYQHDMGTDTPYKLSPTIMGVINCRGYIMVEWKIYLI